ncbi:MAG: hypothetical protein ACUVT7_08350 [Thermoplasmata archaeon]
MLYISSGNLKEGRFKEYQAWAKKNADDSRKHASSGWKYERTCATVIGFGKYGVTDIWEIEKYGDFDRSHGHNDPTFNRIMAEAQDFFRPSQGATVLIREIGDTIGVEPKKPKRR